MPNRKPRVVVVGGGFGGLAAARTLATAPVEVLLVDRNNHHLFQPLLYQVASSMLTTGQIASPVRRILKNSKNTRVILGSVTGVNVDARYIFADYADRSGVFIPYDHLIIATGVEHSYFGHPEYEKHAPGLKSLADAESVRNKLLQAFEIAEAEDDHIQHQDLLTFVLVGGGPTGVELSGAIGVMVRSTIKREFRRIDPTLVRIILVDRGTRLLAAFHPKLSEAAQRRLEDLGVEVRLGQSVDQIDDEGVTVAGERIPSKTVIWTAA